MSTQLKCDVIAYDYSGYGKSEGSSSEREIYNDIEEVADFMKNILNVKTKETILLGQSLGSAPSIHLAHQGQFSEIRAVILISPIASGIKLVSPEIKVEDLEKIDVFSNIKKISDVSCPIFMIHGQKDEIIPIEQSIELAKYIKHPYEWHPRKGDHSNILTEYRTKFFQKCKFFFEYLNFFNKNKKQEESNQKCTTSKGTNGCSAINYHGNKYNSTENSEINNIINPYPVFGYEENYMTEQLQHVYYGGEHMMRGMNSPEKMQDMESFRNYSNSFGSIKFKQHQKTINSNEGIQKNGSSKIILECPFENERSYPTSEKSSCKKNTSDEIYDLRDSKEGNVRSYKDNRDFDEEYDEMCRINGL
jgi:surfactin synthase thioesterase subunit